MNRRGFLKALPIVPTAALAVACGKEAEAEVIDPLTPPVFVKVSDEELEQRKKWLLENYVSTPHRPIILPMQEVPRQSLNWYATHTLDK